MLFGDFMWKIQKTFYQTSCLNSDSEAFLSNVLFELNAKKLVSNYTCYKSVKNSSCINLTITNSPMSFINRNTLTTTTGLSDFQKIVTIVLKTTFAN